MVSSMEDYHRKKSLIKKLKIGAATIATLGVLAASYLTWDAVTKRVSIPERDVVYRATEVVSFKGGEKPQDEERADQQKELTVNRGSFQGRDTKIEDIVATVIMTQNDDQETYTLKNQDNLRVMNATLRNEHIQKEWKWSINGRTNFQEQFADLDIQSLNALNPKRDPTLDPNLNAFFIYRIEPERGLDEIEVDALRLNGQKKLLNRLVESRTAPLGWLYGRNYRAGTSLEKYNLADTDPKVHEFFNLIETYNKLQTIGQAERLDLIDRIKKLEASIPRKPIYFSFEDGILKWNFQDSTIFLGENPSYLKRAGIELIDYMQEIKHLATLGFMPKRTMNEGVIRIENHWDLIPGYIPWLSELRFDKGNNVLSFFDKTNNGGYEIIDNIGTIAQVKIRDFFLHYDNDVIYEYYIDKNGDGKIDEEKELIGKVLFKITYGQREVETDQIGRQMPKKDLTYTYHFSFMGGNASDPVGRYQDFITCAYIESMMPDQVSRGYGKHSRLGYINEVRSAILLFNARNFPNVSRALTQENALVAGHDIYELLKLTKRPFAQKFGERIDIKHDINYTGPNK